MFDLEKAIKGWIKDLHKYEAFEDGLIADLELHLRDVYDSQRKKGVDEEEAFRVAVARVGTAGSIAAEYTKNRLAGLDRRSPLRLSRFMSPLVWNYFKIALRKVRRQIGYSVITIAGLAFGMACCILTMVWTQYEYSFDRFHLNADSIFRVISENPASGESGPVWGAPPSLGPALAAEYPEIVRFSRCWNIPRRYAIQSNRMFSPLTQVCYADPSFFAIFDFPFIEGDPKTALQDPNSVVLTSSSAKKFFGDENALGKSLKAFRPEKLMKVTGILEDIPENSHIQFDIIVPFWSLKSENWTDVTHDLYLQLAGSTSIQEFDLKIQECIKRHDPKTVLQASIQPLKDIHFQQDAEFAWWRFPEKKWIIGQINLFLLFSIVVLIVACINSVNLATARSLKRVKEIGVRKVNGASRLDIIRQSMTESMLVSFMALAAAVSLASFLLPFLRQMTGRRLDLGLLNKGYLGLSLLGLTLVTGFLSGIYPALFSSSFNPVKAMKNVAGKGRLSLLLPRRILVSLQFLCSTLLIIITAVFLLQLNYTNKKDLGYQKENLVVMAGISGEDADAFKNELLKDALVLGTTQSDPPTMSAEGHLFDSLAFEWEGKPPDDQTSMDLITADEDYLETFGLSMVAGRFFSREFPNDMNNVILNESAVRAMGLKDPVGKRFECKRGRAIKGQIIGVVKDYHTSTLKTKIRPTVMVCCKDYAMSWMPFVIRISGQDVGAALEYIESVYKRFQSEIPFSFTFLEDRLASLYLDDRKIGSLIMYYGLLMLVIAGLGLVGLVALFAEQRTKEIGIRRVLGASSPSIVGLLSRELLILVGLSSLLAWPAGYLIASGWLQGFAYRISLSGLIFAAATSFVLAFTLITIALQSIKATQINPVDCLRYE
jgi:putative ABC transport system permease protein